MEDPWSDTLTYLLNSRLLLTSNLYTLFQKSPLTKDLPALYFSQDKNSFPKYKVIGNFRLTAVQTFTGILFSVFKPESLGKGNLNWVNISIRFAYSQVSGTVSWLIIDVGGPINMDGDNPRKVVLGCIRKQAEQVMKNESVNRIPVWLLLQFLHSGYCLEFLPWLPPQRSEPEMYAELNSFLLPKLLFIIVFITIETLTNTAWFY